MRKLKKLPITLATIATLLLFSFSGVQAAITSVTDNLNEISAPSSVAEGVLESNDEIYVFSEGIFTLSSELTVDINTQGRYGDGGGFSLPGGTISTGTLVESFFFHFDVTTDGTEAFGRVTFDQPILGIIAVNDTLDATDFVFGGSRTYETSEKRQLELASTDTINWDNTNSVLIELFRGFDSGTGQVDNMRVITAVPIPGAAVLFLSGLVGLVVIRRR